MSLVRIQSPRPHTFLAMIAVPIRYRRAQKGLFIQKLQHAVPSIVVLGDGIEHLSHEPHGSICGVGVAEVGVSLLVIGSVIRGFRELRKQTAKSDHDVHAHHGVDWIDICLGAMLSVEAYAKFHATGSHPATDDSAGRRDVRDRRCSTARSRRWATSGASCASVADGITRARAQLLHPHDAHLGRGRIDRGRRSLGRDHRDRRAHAAHRSHRCVAAARRS